MKYLLIFLGIVVVLSPLMWLRSSPAQARMTAFRQRALALGLRVQLVPAADADEGDKRPEAVRYLLPGHGFAPTWTLIRSPRRGWESPWPEWRWFRGEAPAALVPAIGGIMASLPATATALRGDREGLSVYWTEQGSVDEVDRIRDCLRQLQGEPVALPDGGE